MQVSLLELFSDVGHDTYILTAGLMLKRLLLQARHGLDGTGSADLLSSLYVIVRAPSYMSMKEN